MFSDASLVSLCLCILLTNASVCGGVPSEGDESAGMITHESRGRQDMPFGVREGDICNMACPTSLGIMRYGRKVTDLIVVKGGGGEEEWHEAGGFDCSQRGGGERDP